MNITVIKGRQLSLWAAVIAHSGAFVLMCLFCCKQLFLHFFILMITSRCVIFGCHSSLFTERVCFCRTRWNIGRLMQVSGHWLIMALASSVLITTFIQRPLFITYFHVSWVQCDTFSSLKEMDRDSSLLSTEEHKNHISSCTVIT